MATIAIVAALPSELAPLTRGWQRFGTGPVKIVRGRIGDYDILASTAGMGAAAVTRACEAVLAASSPSAPVETLISIGYAGSLSCGLRPPDACAIREVIDDTTGERFPTDPLPDPAPVPIKPQRLVTLDRVANPEAKRRLAEQYQATLVDMEAAAVARFAVAHNLRFICFKSVTDGPNDRLPDFGRFTTPEGQIRVPSLMAWALVHPPYWGPLRRLGQNSRQAAQELSNFVSRALSGSIK
jgi:adenosylhomocysteine nucleosidase